MEEAWKVMKIAIHKNENKNGANFIDFPVQLVRVPLIY